jgi:DNA-binding transcriptional MerR regulator
LRLYEEHDLISPGRSSGGLRQYGAAEPVRLNSIVLLKAAGLSLTQIATLSGTDDSQPMLPDLLALQLESSKSRKSDAERGQRIVEAALDRLRLDRGRAFATIVAVAEGQSISASCILSCPMCGPRLASRNA